MNKEQKKTLKNKFKQKELEVVKSSIPMSIQELKDLMTFLDREDVPDCDHTLKETIKFLDNKGLAHAVVIPWLNENGGNCDCEIIYNVYDRVGDIVGWHLEED